GYSRGLFVGLRSGIDLLTGLLPFAWVYVLFGVLVGWLSGRIFRLIKSRSVLWRDMPGFVLSILGFAGGVVFLFLFLWGFNYGRIPVEKQLGLTPDTLQLDTLRAELEAQTLFIEKLRAEIPGATDSALDARFLRPDAEAYMRANLCRVLSENGFPTPGRVRARCLYPPGLLLRISTAGVYIPFTGEGHIDAGLHALQVPFVMAHEMSHGYGFGDEGTCNFWAWLACVTADDPFIRYAGALHHWRSLAGNYRFYQEEAYAKFFEEKIPPGVKNDLRAIYQKMAQYPDVFPRLRDAIYDSYLKAQGIKEGIANYERGMMLIRAWQKRHPGEQ
ncbi:MAG: DUF3810 domain-containing protein, partial [Bacteroidetes bacterium]